MSEIALIDERFRGRDHGNTMRGESALYALARGVAYEREERGKRVRRVRVHSVWWIDLTLRRDGAATSSLGINSSPNASVAPSRCC